MTDETPEVAAQHSRLVAQAKTPGLQEDLHTEFPILADGTILAHNLTPTMAAIVKTANLGDAVVRPQPDKAPATGLKAEI